MEETKPTRRAPQSVAEFIEQTLANPIPVPSAPRKRGEPRPGQRSGIWEKLKTPEERTAHARYLRSLSTAEGRSRSGARPGQKRGWKRDAMAALRVAVELEVDRLVSKLKSKGLIASDDAELIQRTREALIAIRTPVGRKREKARLIRKLLAQFHPEALKVMGL